jgi:hypothetical protein
VAADGLADLGRDAAREAWAEHGGDLDAIPHTPELRAWASAGHSLGLIEGDRELTEPERRAVVHAYRNEIQGLSAAGSLGAARERRLSAPPVSQPASEAGTRPTRGQILHGAVALELAAEQALDPERRVALEACAAWLEQLYIAGGSR